MLCNLITHNSCLETELVLACKFSDYKGSLSTFRPALPGPNSPNFSYFYCLGASNYIQKKSAFRFCLSYQCQTKMILLRVHHLKKIPT